MKQKRIVTVLLLGLLAVMPLAGCARKISEEPAGGTAITESGQPEAGTTAPGTEPGQPETGTAAPGTESGQPEEGTTEPGTETGNPEAGTAAPETESDKTEVRPLKTIYQDYFTIGMALNPTTIGEKYQDTILANIGTVTCENEMKPDYLLDKKASQEGAASDPAFVAVKFEAAGKLIAFCEENGLKMRLHTLVWHAQTPEWFFHEDYDVEKELADGEIMKERMKKYISGVIGYLDEEHPDLIMAIDVVNEAFNGDGDWGVKETDNRWYDTLGSDYVYYAFLYAKEALEASQHMQDVTLVYNDYGMMHKVDKVLNGLQGIFEKYGAHPEDYVDAIGLQAHLDTKTSISGFIKAMKRYGDAGYELQITELDIGIPEVGIGEDPEEKDLDTQGRKYRYLMEALMDLKEDGYPVTQVTVWGLSDDHSWRRGTGGKDAHALLWGYDMAEKPAIRGMALCDDVKSYFTYGLDY